MYINLVNVFNRIRGRLSAFINPNAGSVSRAYDLWSIYYDDQPGNLMLELDELIFTQLLNFTSIENSVIVDIGCGTGRHWKKILVRKPLSLTGYDVSPGMLKILRSKFPTAKTHLFKNNRLEHTDPGSCDLLISTLTIAHMDNLESTIREWARVVKPNGFLIITDYHPDALTKGAKRTFINKGRVIPIKNNIYTVERIIETAKQFNLISVEQIERKIDDSVRHYYVNQNASVLYESFKGTSIIYGLLLKKQNDIV